LTIAFQGRIILILPFSITNKSEKFDLKEIQLSLQDIFDLIFCLRVKTQTYATIRAEMTWYWYQLTGDLRSFDQFFRAQRVTYGFKKYNTCRFILHHD